MIIIADATTISLSDYYYNSSANFQHDHGIITYSGRAGTNSNKALYTVTNGDIAAGTLPVAAGGTGLTTGTYTNAILLTHASSATGSMQILQSTTGALYSTGANVKPTFGTLPVSYGGTGLTTVTSGSVLIGNGTSSLTTRAITNNTSATTATTNSNLITGSTLYYATANINNARQTSNVGIYAPTGGGTAGQILTASGSTSAPV